MDVLVSGSGREPLRLPAPPPRLVSAGLVAVLAAALLSVAPVRRAERHAADLGDLRLQLQVAASTREQGGGLFGVAAVVVDDPRGGEVVVSDVVVAVPGLVHAPLPGRPVSLGTGHGELSVRFVVPECRRLHLPGEVVLRAARDTYPEQTVRRPVARGGRDQVLDGTPLLVACGRAPRPAAGVSAPR